MDVIRPVSTRQRTFDPATGSRARRCIAVERAFVSSAVGGEFPWPGSGRGVR